MIVVGLTGSFASGKSEAARIFKAFGAQVFDADAAAKRAVGKGKPAHRAIKKLWGRDALKKDGTLDRAKMARRVFSHPDELKKLNILIHPGVIFECLRQIAKFKKRKGILVLDVPLLFESRMERLADITVVVRAPLAQMFARAGKRGVSRDLARKILSTQWPMEKKAKKAHFVINNDGSLADLKKKVADVVAKINAEAAQNF